MLIRLKHPRVSLVPLLLLIAVLLVTVDACHKKQNITNVPPGVSTNEVQSWYTATGVLQTVADTGDKGLDLVISLNRQGVFPDSPAYKQTIQSFKAIGQLGLDTKKAMEEAPQKFGQPQRDQLGDFSNKVSAELQKLTSSGLVGVKDPDSQKKITTFINLINSSLQIANAIR
jgi:hypothetical protein